MNIGPDARGNFPETAVEELRKVGAWLSKNGCSIYNCGHSEIEKPEWGRYTEPLEMREDEQFRTVYAHVFEPALGALPLFGIRADALESACGNGQRASPRGGMEFGAVSGNTACKFRRKPRLYLRIAG